MRKSSLVPRDSRIMSQEGQTWEEVSFLRLGSGFETVQFNTGIAAGRQLMQGRSSWRDTAHAGVQLV